MENFIVSYFKVHHTKGRVTKSGLYNARLEAFFNVFLYPKPSFGASEKNEWIVFLMQLTNPDFYDRYERFFHMLKHLIYYRNNLAHNTANVNQSKIQFIKKKVKLKGNNKEVLQLASDHTYIDADPSTFKDLLHQIHFAKYVFDKYKGVFNKRANLDYAIVFKPEKLDKLFLFDKTVQYTTDVGIFVHYPTKLKPKKSR